MKKKEIGVYSILILFMYLTMFYADLTVTAQYSMVFLDSLFDGKFMSFYSNALASGIAPEGAVYDIGMYIVFGIWGLPIWLGNKIFDLNYLSVGSLLWFKLLLIVVAAGILYYTKKIAAKLELSDNNHYEVWLLMLSIVFLFPFLVIAQYDILPLLCIMIGIYTWLDKSDNRFIIWFAISMTMKPFGVFSLLLLLLLREKNILKLILNTILGVLPLVAVKFIYMINADNVATNNTFMEGNLPGLFRSSISSARGDISLFFFVLFIAYIAAYFYKWDKDIISNGKYMIWLNYVMWAAFCVLGTATPYWIVYLAPFLVFVAIYDKQRINQVLILELVVNLVLIAIKIIQYGWVYGGKNTFAYLLMKPIYLNRGEVNSVNGVLVRIGIEQFEGLLQAVLLACVVMIGYYSYLAMKRNNKESVVIHKAHWGTRLSILVMWIAINLVCLI